MAGVRSDIWIDYGMSTSVAGGPTLPHRAMAVALVDATGNEIGGLSISGTVILGTSTAVIGSVTLSTGTALAGTMAVAGSGVYQAGTAVPNSTAGSTDTQVSTGVTGLRFIGFSAKADATSTFAEFRFINGTGATSTVVWGPVTLTAGESTGIWLGPDGIGCAAGLFLDRVTGLTDVTPILKTVV